MIGDKAKELEKLPPIRAAAPAAMLAVKTGTDDAPDPGKSVDRPADSRGADSMAKITTYGDGRTLKKNA